MGKAGFAHLSRMASDSRFTCGRMRWANKEYALYQLLDIGDIIGVEGYLFRTRTGELSVHVGTPGFSRQDAAVDARKSGTAWKMSRPVIASVISI